MAQSAGANGTPAPPVVEVIDEAPARIRRSLDLLRLVGLILILIALAGLGSLASATAHASNQDLARLLGHIPRIFTRSLSLLGALGVLVVPIYLVLRTVLRGQTRRLLEGLMAGLVAIVIVGLLDVAISTAKSSGLHASLTDVAHRTTSRPLDAYLAALFALALVIGVTAEPRWRALFWSAVGVYVASAFVAQQASVLTLAASPVIGAAVGIATLYSAGRANDRPGAGRVVDELALRGISLRRIERVPRRHEQYRQYNAQNQRGDELTVQIFDRDLIASGTAYRVYRRLRIRADVAAPPEVSLEHIAERRSLLTLAAIAADVHIPRFLAGVPCGPDTIVLVYDRPTSFALEDPTDEQLRDLWRNLTRLHNARMTHRGVTAQNLRIDVAGRILLPTPTDGAIFASELRIGLDRAQALVATAQLVGSERAVLVAGEALGAHALAATVTLLQPIALPLAIRSAVKRDPDLLSSIREQVRRTADEDVAEPIRVERFRPRTVLSIAALVVAGYLLVGQLSSVNLVTVFARARWGWVPLTLLASAGTYVAAALCLTGFVTERLSFSRTTLVQVAASFVGFVTPPSVGGVAINIRYLLKARLSPAAATTSVGVTQVSNGVLHAVLLIIFATATGVASPRSLPIPGWAFAAIGVLALIMLALLAIPSLRRWVLARTLPPLREALPRLVEMVSSPLKLVEALSGALLLNACYMAALWCSVRAFGGHLGVAAVAVVYLAGAAVAAVAPTPGGLGAVEIALSTGLAGAGMPSAAAVSAVLLFRIATFWLPVPAGWLALRHLRRQAAL